MDRQRKEGLCQLLWTAAVRMSFPPHLNRPPMGIPALPPGIPPPQFPGFPPPVPPGTPMIPVPMSIMAPAPTVLVPTVSMVGKHLGARKDHPGLKAKENDENCGPTTTVFVGNISEKASDMLIRQLLAPLASVSIRNLSLPSEKRSYLLKLTQRQRHNWMSGKQRRKLLMGYVFIVFFSRPTSLSV
uniref:RNA binding motif protein 25 n=1 Tax=Canis lupus dingo TaxID=286419 RepID=A0A8C0QV60_CANLU